MDGQHIVCFGNGDKPKKFSSRADADACAKGRKDATVFSRYPMPPEHLTPDYCMGVFHRSGLPGPLASKGEAIEFAIIHQDFCLLIDGKIEEAWFQEKRNTRVSDKFTPGDLSFWIIDVKRKRALHRSALGTS